MIISLAGMFQDEVYPDSHPRWKGLNEYANSCSKNDLDLNVQKAVGCMVLADHIKQTTMKSVKYIRNAGADIEEYFDISNRYVQEQDVEYEKRQEDAAREDAKRQLFGDLDSARSEIKYNDMDNITTRLLIDILEYTTCCMFFDRMPNMDILSKNTIRLYNMLENNRYEKQDSK